MSQEGQSKPLEPAKTEEADKQVSKPNGLQVISENPEENDEELDDFLVEGTVFNCTKFRYFIKTLRWLSCVSLMLYLLAAIICTALLENHLNGLQNLFSDSITNSLNNFPQNMKALPIIDIELRNGDQNCTKGYEEVVLSTWKGTKRGCYNASGVVPKLSDGNCPSDCTDCSQVAEIGEQNITIWNEQKLCISRAKDALYALNCPSGYRKCDRGVCINEPMCPISFLTYVKEQKVNADDFIKIGDGYLALARGTNKSALINIKISVGAPFSCFDGKSWPLRKSSEDYSLALQNNGGCGEFGFDLQTYEIMDTLEIDLYNQQDWSKSISDLPLFSETLQEEKAYLLGERQYEMK